MTPYVYRAGLAGFLALLLLTPSPARGQRSDATSGWAATREALTAELATQDGLATSTVYGARLRGQAAGRAAAIRERLERGDFEGGDRFTIQVTGTLALFDTLTVSPAQSVRIPNFRELELRGVLLSELEGVVQRHLVQSVRDAVVTAHPLVRIAVFGAVTTPGYQSVPLQTRLDALLMGAGGPISDADPSRLRVMRGADVILEGAQVLDAIAAGGSIASLGLREGDYLSVPPRRPPWDRAATISIITVITGPLIAFLLVR